MGKKVNVLDKSFEIFIEAEKIQEAIKNMADKMNTDLKNQDVIFGVGEMRGGIWYPKAKIQGAE